MTTLTTLQEKMKKDIKKRLEASGYLSKNKNIQGGMICIKGTRVTLKELQSIFSQVIATAWEESKKSRDKEWRKIISDGIKLSVSKHK